MGVLTHSDQKKVFLVTFVQISMGALDLLGVIAIGILGALSVTGLQSHTPGSRIGTLLRFFHLSNAPFQIQATVIGSAAVILLVGRTLLSIYFTRRMLFFFSRRGAVITTLISRAIPNISRDTLCNHRGCQYNYLTNFGDWGRNGF